MAGRQRILRFIPRKIIWLVIGCMVLLLIYKLTDTPAPSPHAAILSVNGLPEPNLPARDTLISRSTLDKQPVIQPALTSDSDLEEQPTSPVLAQLNKDWKDWSRGKYLPAMVNRAAEIFKELPPAGYMGDHKSNCWLNTRGTLKCLPQVYLAGMIKCGTTDLFDKLVWHPEVLEPPIGKEIRWWTKARFEGKPFSGYIDNMTPDDMSQHKNGLLVDGDPNIMYDLGDWEGRFTWAHHPPYTNADIIKLVTPAAKMIVMFRNPTERLWSGYLFGSRGDTRTVHGHVARDITIFNDCLAEHDFRHCCYNRENNVFRHTRLNIGIYMCWAVDFREIFGENMYTLTTEEYSNHQMQTMKDLFRFLGVSTDIDFTPLEKMFTERVNERHAGAVQKGELPAETRKLLDDFYRPYNEQLAEYLGDAKYLFTDVIERDTAGRKYGHSRSLGQRGSKRRIKW